MNPASSVILLLVFCAPVALGQERWYNDATAMEKGYILSDEGHEMATADPQYILSNIDVGIGPDSVRVTNISVTDIKFSLWSPSQGWKGHSLPAQHSRVYNYKACATKIKIVSNGAPHVFALQAYCRFNIGWDDGKKIWALAPDPVMLDTDLVKVQVN